MNKQKLEKAVKWVCMGDSDSLWNAEDYLSVFQDFFKAYRFFTGREHPEISYSQIVNIMDRMPFADQNEEIPVEPGDYTIHLIPAYFCDSSLECDHSIYHFFSGRIREMRYYDFLKEDF